MLESNHENINLDETILWKHPISLINDNKK